MLPKWGVPIEVRVGFLLMLIGDINVIVALLHWNLPTILLIMFLIELFGGLIVFFLSIFTSEDEYKRRTQYGQLVTPFFSAFLDH